MSISRGKRHSLVVNVGRWRIRVALGRFVWAFERKRDPKFGCWSGNISLKFLLITFLQRTKPAARQARAQGEGETANG